jgi:hypothetical protein
LDDLCGHDFTVAGIGCVDYGSPPVNAAPGVPSPRRCDGTLLPVEVGATMGSGGATGQRRSAPGGGLNGAAPDWTSGHALGRAARTIRSPTSNLTLDPENFSVGRQVDGRLRWHARFHGIPVRAEPREGLIGANIETLAFFDR